MTQLYKGSCLCGAITFEAGGLQTDPAHCHCRMCRKFHGAAFGTLAEAKTLNWLTGSELVRHYKADNGTVRSFCERCGSSLAFRSNDDPNTPFEIAVSLFDEDVPITVEAQIFTRYKANWYPLDTDLAIFPDHRESPSIAPQRR